MVDEMLQRMAVTVSVITRHAKGCKDRKKGSDWKKCNCRKAILVYEGGGSGKNRRISAKTRSWEKAEKAAQEIRDSFDPDKVELKRLRAAKEREQKSIVDAVALYIADLIARLGDNGTVAMARSLFGHVDPESKAIVKNGRLFDWLDKLPATERPTYIADFSPALVTAWRSAWDFQSDLTTSNRWTMVKGFFRFCESQGWIEDTPTRKLKAPSVRKGNRTAIFSDDQFAKILEAVVLYDPENTPEATRKAWRQRLATFVHLLRWSGMAIVDAALFRPDSVDAEGVLRYRRKKSGELAVVPLPQHLLQMLAEVPLERDSVGADQPFRSKRIALGSDSRKWEHRLTNLFALAGIEEVRTPMGTLRKPHPHMLRDTFAIWFLRKGTSVHTVSKMLGHANTKTTEKAYLPWVKELEQAHVADARRALGEDYAK